LFWDCPNGKDVNVADTFIQYDSNGDTITSENVYNAANRLNFGGRYKSLCSMLRLRDGCAKVKIAMHFSVSDDLSIRSIVANGNRMYLTGTRQVYWRKPRVTSIDGIVINHTYKNPLEGLTICCLGDSITDFGNGSLTYKYGYPAYIQSRFDCACINYGRGNARFIDQSNTDYTMNTDPGTPPRDTTGYNNNKVSTQVRWMLREMQEDEITPDVVILSGGTNDCFSDVSYGSLETAMASYGNTTDAVKTTFYDAAVYMVSKIRAAFPNVKIFFGTPINSLQRGSGANQHDRLPAWRDAMIAAAKAMGCGIIDWYAESGIVDYPVATWNNGTSQWNHSNPCFNTNDGIHPSKLGVDMMAKLAVSEISKAFPT
jgi:lysophospholipase L1-like esterase